MTSGAALRRCWAASRRMACGQLKGVADIALVRSVRARATPDPAHGLVRHVGVGLAAGDGGISLPTLVLLQVGFGGRSMEAAIGPLGKVLHIVNDSAAKLPIEGACAVGAVLFERAAG